MPLKVAFFSPLPPARSGIADYSAALLAELQKLVDVEVFATRPPAFNPARLRRRALPGRQQCSSRFLLRDGAGLSGRRGGARSELASFDRRHHHQARAIGTLTCWLWSTKAVLKRWRTPAACETSKLARITRACRCCDGCWRPLRPPSFTAAVSKPNYAARDFPALWRVSRMALGFPTPAVPNFASAWESTCPRRSSASSGF